MILIANDGRRFLRFDLFPLGTRHRDWHGYSIALGDVERGEIAKLEATTSTPLFLDREVTPEIPMMCEGMERAIEGVPFSFSPADERDFEFAVRRSANGIMVQIQTSDFRFEDATGWPLGVEVSTDALRRFVAGLRIEYEQIMSCLPLR